MKRKKELLYLGFIVIVFLIIGYLDQSDGGNLPPEFSAQQVSELDIHDEDESLGQEDLSNKAYIIGEVQNPGVYEFQAGDRLEDLIVQAGGCTELANLEAVNLALNLKDEMKIYIPSIEEEAYSMIDGDNLTTGSAHTDLVNINEADLEELKTLNGIGEVKAKAIIQFREELPFKKIEEILNVPGIGPGVFEQIKDSITI